MERRIFCDFVIFLWLLLVYTPVLRGTEYKYFTSREGVACKSNDGEQPYHGILKAQFCSGNVVGKKCQNDKFCEDDEICECNTKCESWRCIKGKRIEGTVNSTSLDSCLPIPCKNNGTCKQNDTNPNDYICNCPDKFGGKNCSSCKKTGFTGFNCETDINECEQSATVCHHGNCTNTLGSFKCTCSKNWDGPRCDKEINICDSLPCKNGARCVRDDNNKIGYECRCKEGFEGTRCEIKNPCQNQQCGKGQCINGTCICPRQFTGKQCENEINLCQNVNCGNDGTCNKTTGQCSCSKDFTGKNCEICIGVCENMTCPYQNCSTSLCDPVCNIPACNYSGFQCTLGVDPFKKCLNTKCRSLAGDGICAGECDNVNCLFDGGDCLNDQKCPYEDFCKSAYNDGQCDLKCNNKACGYDKLDCSKNDDPKIAPGRIVMEVDSTYDNFKAKQNEFERTISILLNTYVSVESVKIIKNRVRRSNDGGTKGSKPKLEVKLTLDNRKCSQCFTTEQAARYLALKNSQGELRLPVTVGKVSSEETKDKTGIPPMTPLWIVLIVAVPVLSIGVIFKGRKVVSKLWRTEDARTQGQRGTPVGQESNELRTLQEEETPAKRRKFDHNGILDHTTPFLSMTSAPSTNSNQIIKTETNGYEHTLHYAAAYGHETIIRQQMDLVDVNTRDKLGRTALHIAVSVGRDNIVHQLTRNRKINIDVQDDEGNTPLMEAVSLHHNAYVKELIHLGSRVSLSNKQGRSALHIAAMVDNAPATQLLIQHNARVDVQDIQLRTPLHWAVKEGSYKTVPLLIASSASPTASDIDDITPLMIAKRNGNQQMMFLLSRDNIDIIPSPKAISPAEVSPQAYQDIRPKLPFKDFRGWERCLGDIPDWVTLPTHHQQPTTTLHFNRQPEQFNFIGTSPFDTPSPCIGESELSPFSDSIPCIMTPPQSWGSPQSIES